MSELLDSLRRRRPAADAGSAWRRTAQGDAVLATLGYPGRRRPATRAIVLLGGATVAIGWMAWQWSDAPPSPSSATPARTESAQVPAAAPVAASSAREPAPPDVPPVPASRPSDSAPGGRPSRAASARVPAAPIGSIRSEPPAPAVEVDAAAPADLMSLALYHHRAGDFEKALLHYRLLLRQNELNAPAHNNLGMLYEQKNLLEEAAREFQRAVLIDPRYALARNNYGAVLLRQDRVDAAAAEFRAVLELEPGNVDALVNLALADRAAGRSGPAISSLVRAIGMAPDHAVAHYNLAVLHDEAGEAARAIDHYGRFLETAGPEYADRAPQVRARIDALARR